MRFALACVFLGSPWYAVIGCLALCAQAPPNGVIAGIVLDGERNAPIHRAIVTLSTVEARPQDAVAWTDAIHCCTAPNIRPTAAAVIGSTLWLRVVTPSS